MANSSCLFGPPFSITGNKINPSASVNFQIDFENDADQNDVLVYEWYLNDNLILDNNDPIFVGDLDCGNHRLGVRLLLSTGWSGIKNIMITTCEVPLLNLVGPTSIEEGEMINFQVIATFSDNSILDYTSQFVFSASEGVFTNGSYTAVDNTTYFDNRQIIVTASNGTISLTQPLNITDTTPVTLVSTEIIGASSVNEGNSATYNIIETYSNSTTQDVTGQFIFSATEGSFSGSTYTAINNSGYNDSRQITISASKSGLTINKNIIINDTTPVTLVSTEIIGASSVNEGNSATYNIIETYSNSTTQDVTGQFIFSTTEGSFSGSTYTAINNSGYNDSRQITISASKSGLTINKNIIINDTTPVTLVSTEIIGASSVNEGNSAAYTVIETYSNSTTQDVTGQFTFSATEGTFSGSTYTAITNSGYNDGRTITITASKSGLIINKNITINDATPVTLVSTEIIGASTVNEGSSAAYTVIETYSNSTTQDVTGQFTFSATEGSFSGSTYTAITNSTASDTREITITASKSGSVLTKSITIVDITTVFLSSIYSESATKNNCPAGYTGSSVTLTATAGQFTSTISQADANQQAINWVQANKQANANANGTCIGNPLNINWTLDEEISPAFVDGNIFINNSRTGLTEIFISGSSTVAAISGDSITFFANSYVEFPWPANSLLRMIVKVNGVEVNNQTVNFNGGGVEYNLGVVNSNNTYEVIVTTVTTEPETISCGPNGIDVFEQGDYIGDEIIGASIHKIYKTTRIIEIGTGTIFTPTFTLDTIDSSGGIDAWKQVKVLQGTTVLYDSGNYYSDAIGGAFVLTPNIIVAASTNIILELYTKIYILSN